MQQLSPTITVAGISKQYGNIHALDDVGFVVPRASVFCILGPNGAGKTTLLKILTTVTRPDKGTAQIEGFNILTDALAVRGQIGVVAQENRFDHYLSVWNNLILHAQLHGMPAKVYEPRIRQLLEQVDLYDRRNNLLDELSGGMQRRISLIRALIHQPKVLFLDEPTTGLDPQARLEIWHTIEAFKQSATVILTTHYMEEADRLSDDILMLHHGKVVAAGTAKTLKQAISPINDYELILNAPKAHQYSEILNACLPTQTQSGQTEALSDYELRLHLQDPGALRRILETIDPRDIVRFGRIEANLEDVFLAIAASPLATPQAGA